MRQTILNETDAIKRRTRNKKPIKIVTSISSIQVQIRRVARGYYPNYGLI